MKKATNNNKKTVPKTTNYYYKWQLDEYEKVKSKRGKEYADKRYEAKHGR